MTFFVNFGINYRDAIVNIIREITTTGVFEAYRRRTEEKVLHTAERVCQTSMTN